MAASNLKVRLKRLLAVKTQSGANPPSQGLLDFLAMLEGMSRDELTALQCSLGALPGKGHYGSR